MAWTMLHVLLLIQAVLTYLLVLYHIWSFAISPLRSVKFRAFFNRLPRRLWKKCRNLVRCMGTRHTGILRRAIQEHMVEFRLAQCRRFMAVGANILALILLVMAWHVHKIGDDLPDDRAQLWVIRTSVILCLYLFFLLVTMGHVPINSLAVDMMLVTIFGGVTLHFALMTDQPNFFLENGLLLFARLAVGIGFLDHWKSIPCNIVTSIVLCWRFPYNNAVFGGPHEQQRHDYMAFIAREVFACFWVSWGPYVVQTWLEARFQAQIIGQNQTRATFKLAAYHCDAACWLTPDLHLNQPAPQLAHMLIYEQTQHHLNGRKFTNYIATEADRQRFLDFLETSTAASEPDGLPALFHMDLRDSNRRVFPVEVFHSCFVDDKDKIGHLLGVSEPAGHGNRRNLGNGTGQPDERPALAAPLAPTAYGRPPRDNSSASGTTETEGESSVFSEALMPLIPEDKALAPVSVVFDGVTCRMFGCTTGFATLLGPLVYKASILTLLAGSSTAFMAWQQDETNLLLGNQARESSVYKIQLTQHSCKNQLKFQVEADAVMIHVDVNASPSKLGVQHPGKDTPRGILCVMELRNAEVRGCDQKKEEKGVIGSDAEPEGQTYAL